MKSSRLFSLPAFYPITDLKIARRETHLEIVKDLVGGGAKIIQIRDKQLSTSDLLIQVGDVLSYARKKKVKIIVNDRVDLVMATDADGVHLGQEDLPVEKARKLLGAKKIIGLSTHSRIQALKGAQSSADYISIGPIFRTATKGTSDLPLGVGIIKSLRAQISKPLVAIGGITLERVGDLLVAGANSVALVSDLLSAPDITKKAKAYVEMCSRFTVRRSQFST